MSANGLFFVIDIYFGYGKLGADWRACGDNINRFSFAFSDELPRSHYTPVIFLFDTFSFCSPNLIRKLNKQ